jgi:ABC-type uncharacterized transport system substrate-binding protein
MYTNIVLFFLLWTHNVVGFELNEVDNSTNDINYYEHKVLHISSYHVDYQWTQGIVEGVNEVLTPTGVLLQTFYMDTKRFQSEPYKHTIALAVKYLIDEFQPDVVIASDDNASKYVVEPYFKNTDLPIVFCGVNWTEKNYNYPYTNTTGMVEISLIKQLIEHLSRYAKGKKVGFLAENRLSEKKSLQNHQTMLGIHYEVAYFANSVKEWKKYYLALQQEVDMLIILGYAGLAGWKNDEMRKFILQHTTIPTGTDLPWAAALTLIGMGKSPQEQGRWAAHAALDILRGQSPQNIPITHNKQGHLYINLRLANQLGILFESQILKIATLLK